MIRRRTATLAGMVALAATALAGTAHAQSVDDPARVETTRSGRYWACVAVDHVHVGACLENPLPDLSDYGTLRGIIREHTGVRVP